MCLTYKYNSLVWCKRFDSCPQLYYSIPSIARDPNVQSSTEHKNSFKNSSHFSPFQQKRHQQHQNFLKNGARVKRFFTNHTLSPSHQLSNETLLNFGQTKKNTTGKSCLIGCEKCCSSSSVKKKNRKSCLNGNCKCI